MLSYAIAIFALIIAVTAIYQGLKSIREKEKQDGRLKRQCPICFEMFVIEHPNNICDTPSCWEAYIEIAKQKRNRE